MNEYERCIKYLNIFYIFIFRYKLVMSIFAKHFHICVYQSGCITIIDGGVFLQNVKILSYTNIFILTPSAALSRKILSSWCSVFVAGRIRWISGENIQSTIKLKLSHKKKNSSPNEHKQTPKIKIHIILRIS